jgi:hypothetical protein
MFDIKRKNKPRGKPFPKGVSGNPTGKRRRLATVDDVFMGEMFKKRQFDNLTDGLSA